MTSNKIDYLITKDNEKLLPWQYYNQFHYISIPIKDKNPLIPNWQNRKETIVPLYLGLNIGLLTGEKTNLLILDIDIKDDGIKLWNSISKKYPTFKTPTVKSPGGSIHFYFKYNNKIPNMNRILINNKKIGWDIKSNGSIITAPPSIYPNTNKRYKWINGYSLNELKPVSMPKWLQSFILNHIKPFTKNRLNL